MNPERILLEIKGLTVTFSRWGQTVKALDDVSLTIPAGQWVMLVGHNGSGKSTMLNAISRQLRPDRGEISINGDVTSKLLTSQIAERLYLVHQDPLLGTAPTLTLFENLMVADHLAQDSNLSRRELSEKYYDLLRPLGLSDRLKQLTRYLSGGERQLLALLVARLRPSRLLLLDEPLAALDPGKAELCLEQIRQLQQEGKTILQVTHDLRLGTEGGDRTLILSHGRIVYDEKGHNRNATSLQRFWGHDVHGRQGL